MTYRNCQFTWLKQKETLVSLAESLLKDEIYFDCQLCAEGHHFNVHRVILSCNSPILNNLLQDHNVDLPVITLEGVSSSVVSALVEFMYTGVTKISPSNLKNFFHTAKSLKLAGLSHYDNAQLDKIVIDNSDQSINSEFQQNGKNYNQNILKYLDQSDRSSESNSRNLIPKDETMFLEESVDTNDVVNDNEIQYEKYDSSFMKDDDGVESLDACLIESNDLSQNYEVESDESITRNTPLMYNKFHSVFIKNEDSFTDNIATIYSISKADDSDIKEDNEFIELQDELKVTDEDENFVYIKLENNTLEKIKDSQSVKGRQNSSKHEAAHPHEEKCFKSNYSVKSNYLVKKPKIQSEVTNNARTNSEDKKIYICLKCGNKYSHRRTLLHHIHWICEQPATYSCSLCPYRGKRKFQLKSHMKHAHLLKMS